VQPGREAGSLQGLGRAAAGRPTLRQLATASVRVVAYQPARGYADDFLCWGVATMDFKGWFTKGQKVYQCGKSSDSGGAWGFVEGFASGVAGAFGDLVSMGRGLVNQASAGFASIKSAAVGVVVDGMKGTVGCGAECQWAVGAAVDAGLASMGVPPSLPDFDQLVAALEGQGVDALADAAVKAAASQGVPLPKEVARQAILKLKAEAQRMAASGGPGGVGEQPFKPDPDRAYRPAALTFEAWNADGEKPSAPTTVRILNGKVVGGGSQHALVSGGGLFQTANVPLPSLRPFTSVRFVVTVEPMRDPHEWLALMDQANRQLADAFSSMGGYPCGFQPLQPPPTLKETAVTKEAQKRYDDWKACDDAYRVKSALKTWGYQSLLAKAGDSRKAWSATYTNQAVDFDLALASGDHATPIAALDCRPRKLRPGTASEGTCVATFTEPAWLGRRVDYCLSWARDCGMPAAQVFCKRMGYFGAGAFEVAPTIGAETPTFTMADLKTCDQAGCSGFARINCIP